MSWIADLAPILLVCWSWYLLGQVRATSRDTRETYHSTDRLLRSIEEKIAELREIQAEMETIAEDHRDRNDL